jgi:hypothetical protein
MSESGVPVAVGRTDDEEPERRVDVVELEKEPEVEEVGPDPVPNTDVLVDELRTVDEL